MLSRLFCFAAAAAAASAASTAVPASSSRVKYVIVVMMENRSFDHLLGHLGLTNADIDGLQVPQSNPVDPQNASSPRVPVAYDAIDGGPSDPLHDFDSITQQIYGFHKGINESAAVTMDGFVANAAASAKSFVMSAFNDTNLPVLSSLARDFAVFDHWHCSCPCPTNPNREFLMSGTSHGMTVNTIPEAGFPQQTHFGFLNERGVDSKIYFNDDPWMAPTFAELRSPFWLDRTVEMPQFFADLAGGSLPQYSLIQPRMATSKNGTSNWQHPDNSVEAGEIFYASIYEALRASPYWEESLLIITYDEHGGFFDHQAPSEAAPAPDSILGDNGFDFTRLGVRIPTVMVSPWIAKGTVVHRPTGARAPQATSEYDATSIMSSANKIFGITDHMSLRDSWAGTFHDLVDGSTPLRTDCPRTLAKPPAPSAEQIAREEATPFNDHHFDSINLLCHLAAHVHPACAGFAGDRAPFLAELEAAAAAPAALAAAGARTAGARTGADSAWAHSAEWPHVFAGAARLLQQQHFEGISRSLFTAYKSATMAAAEAAAAASA